MDNKIHWLILQGIPRGDVGIMNAYASNIPTQPCTMWKSVIQNIPNHCCWLIVGDFNIVETRQDKTNQCGRLVTLRERDSFQVMKQYLQIDKVDRSTGSMRYSWDNLRLDGICVLACLNRIYTFKSLVAQAD